ncbi:late histone H2A.1 [Culex quinquefasciatus]|uniref:Histone H2A n=1 Tax=Culex quinquefasciatus TaxID=7176 RepID=B0XHJ9_CULQU|nr:late histone H2A.1 [Culex quinquefasciatus]|eukprot:XP_001869121.1 late histone H2A.1 [Culex quinquefasciatus]
MNRCILCQLSGQQQSYGDLDLPRGHLRWLERRSSWPERRVSSSRLFEKFDLCEGQLRRCPVFLTTIFGGGSPRVGWKRCTGQQEDSDIPRHLQLAIQNDEELYWLMLGVTISQGGVLPNIHAVLLPKKTQEEIQRRQRINF